MITVLRLIWSSGHGGRASEASDGLPLATDWQNTLPMVFRGGRKAVGTFFWSSASHGVAGKASEGRPRPAEERGNVPAVIRGARSRAGRFGRSSPAWGAAGQAKLILPKILAKSVETILGTKGRWQGQLKTKPDI
jgi:hypothetical protein